MNSQVFFVAVDEQDSVKVTQAKLSRLLNESKIFTCLDSQDKAVIKMHFGEEGNTGFVKPEYLRVIHQAIRQRQAEVVLADTNTLYRGRRMNSQDHLQLAYEHGFTVDKTGAQVVIPDDSKRENTACIAIKQRFVREAKIARLFTEADALIGVAHFKGHMMTGFGGALKNIGMGCATREGKLQQHCDLSPVVISKKCVGCGACVEVCPEGAITVARDRASLKSAKCIGCASCIAACDYRAIDINWEAGSNTIQQKMVEYAYAVLSGKEKKRAFLNFAIKITQECDCLAKDDPRIAPDVGILASADPVSIDVASMDLVNKACAKNIFKKIHPHRNGLLQLRYACRLGLGNLDYELIEL